jgi:hypothetical protein
MRTSLPLLLAAGAATLAFAGRARAQSSDATPAARPPLVLGPDAAAATEPRAPFVLDARTGASPWSGPYAAPPCPPPGPPPPPPPPWGRRPDTTSSRLTIGPAFTEGIRDGLFARLETDSYAVRGLGIAGAHAGLEGWASHDGGGGGLPMSFYAGLRSRGRTRVVGTLGAGFDLFLYDRILHTGGFGIFAPFGTADVGVDMHGVRILADARAQYRWQWFADDRAQLQIGLTLAVDSRLWLAE